jgi:hypothetical protein
MYNTLYLEMSDVDIMPQFLQFVEDLTPESSTFSKFAKVCPRGGQNDNQLPYTST